MNIESIRDINELFIYKNRSLIGRIKREKNSSIFIYENSFLEQVKDKNLDAVALSMPTGKKEYLSTAGNLHPFFAGLLPEGLRLTALISNLKTSADDMFSLLAASGHDCIGDIFASIEKHPKRITKDISQSLETVSFHQLFETSIHAKELIWRMKDSSIPGVHPKISSEMISFPISIKKNNTPCILKLSPKPYPQLVENEHFFMKMAKNCGINTAKTKIIYDKDQIAGLLVERFDRFYDKKNKTIEKIHQEDACQFTEHYPQDKYRLSTRDIADGLIKYSTSPLIDILKLLELKAFSYLISNGDLHAKNVSILIHPETKRVSLSPAYDLLSTLPYGDQSMALHFEGRRSNLRLKEFKKFSERYHLPESAVKAMLIKLQKKITPWIEKVDEIGLSKKKTNFLKETMRKRLEHVKV